MADAPITLSVDDSDITFNVDVDAFNAYINEMQPNNKVAPSHNFLMRTVDQKDREALSGLLKIPGAPIDIATAVVEAYKPGLRITVKK